MVYLAMTAAELRNTPSPPENLAWMACHFSPYGTGLTNVPTHLPPGSILMLNDRTPVHGHDPKCVAQTLQGAVEKNQCSGILLDFQRPCCGETAAIVDEILTLPCPVCVSQPYAESRDCPILLPPVPMLKTAEEYLAPWHGREVWLELALDGCTVTVTEAGSAVTPLAPWDMPGCPSCDVQLSCHFGVVFDQKRAVFSLKRSKNDLQNLQKAAEKQGITHFLALWQELGR